MGPPRPTFEGNDNERGWMDFFQDGVHSFTPSQKKTFVGRILPGFDWSLPVGTPEFQQGYTPYRDASQIGEDNQALFNSFFIRVPCYSFFGKASSRFLSPSVRKYMVGDYDPSDMWDPVQDIRNVAVNHSDPTIKALTKKEEGKIGNPTIPYPGWKCFYNFYGHDISNEDWKNAVVVVPSNGGKDLGEKLSEWRPAQENILDKNWPNYLYGDITDPQTGLTVTAKQIPGTPQSFGGFAIVQGKHKTAQGARPQAVSDEVIAARYNLWSEDALKVYSYQELVDFMVEDGDVPYELIEQACSGRANVAKKPTSYKAASTAQEPRNTQPPTSNTQQPPAPAPPQEQVSTPPPPAPIDEEEEKFWVSKDGKVLPDLYPKSAVDGFVASGSTVLTMPKDQSTTWEAVKAPSTPPAPPVTDDSVELEEVSPTQQALVQATQVADADGLTAEQKAQWEELDAKGPNNLTPEELSEWARLGALMG